MGMTLTKSQAKPLRGITCKECSLFLHRQGKCSSEDHILRSHQIACNGADDNQVASRSLQARMQVPSFTMGTASTKSQAEPFRVHTCKTRSLSFAYEEHIRNFMKIDAQLIADATTTKSQVKASGSKLHDVKAHTHGLESIWSHEETRTTLQETRPCSTGSS